MFEALLPEGTEPPKPDAVVDPPAPPPPPKPRFFGPYFWTGFGFGRLYDKTRDSGVVFLVVSDEKPERIAEYLKKNPLSMPVYRATKGRPAGFQTDAIPATFILAPDGRVAFSHTGAAKWDDETTLAFLRALPPRPQTP